MEIIRNAQLRRFNTFQVEALARRFARFSNTEELRQLIQQHQADKIYTLGGGSNVLFTGPVDGLVLKNDVTGVEVIRETEREVLIRAGAGVVWHDLVMYSVHRHLGGIENLALIPGSVGAAPMQNIGAYGVELKETFVALEALHLRDLKIQTFTSEECRFGYRDSIFKQELKNQFVILNVTLRLTKKPVFKTSYGAIEEQLAAMGVGALSVRAVADAVIAIRKSKLPDPTELANAGSFFKNPVLPEQEFERLERLHPGIVHFRVAGGVKLAAAWLIEQCGLKGYRQGPVACHVNQPLVIVNLGGATGSEIFAFSEMVIRKVQRRFDVVLEREVNLIP